MSIKALSRPITMLLTTMDRLKFRLGITGTDQDDLLYQLLVSASSTITRECYGSGQLGFGVVQVEEWLKGTGSQLLGLSQTPLMQILSVYEDDVLVTQSDPTDGYWIEDAEAGALYRPAGWGQNVSLLAWGTEAYGSRYILPGGTNRKRYRVTYIGGYLMPGQEDYLPYDQTAGTNPTLQADAMPLPGAIEQACIETVKYTYLTAARDYTITSAEVDGARVTYGNTTGVTTQLPAIAMAYLRDYRKVVA